MGKLKKQQIAIKRREIMAQIEILEGMRDSWAYPANEGSVQERFNRVIDRLKDELK